MANEDNFLRLDQYNFNNEFIQDLFLNLFTVNELENFYKSSLISYDEYIYGKEYLEKLG